MKHLRRLAEKAIRLDCMSPTMVAYEAAANPSTIIALLDRLDEAEKILNTLASWNEGDTVGPWFDDPHSASLCREYFKKYEGEK